MPTVETLCWLRMQKTWSACIGAFHHCQMLIVKLLQTTLHSRDFQLVNS